MRTLATGLTLGPTSPRLAVVRDRRSEILDAAAVLITERGFRDTSIDEAFPVTWLETGYKLTPNEAAVVAGTALRYDIAEIVDPLVHVVGKIPKEAVVKLK